MGGTFMSLNESYRDTFISQLHNSLSGYTGNNIDEAVRCALEVPELQFRGRRLTGIPSEQVRGAGKDEVHWHHHRDAAGLLPQTAPEVRIHGHS